MDLKSSSFMELNTLDRIILLGILFKLFIGDYLGIGKLLNLVLVVLMLLLLVIERRRMPRRLLLCLPLLALPIFFSVIANQDIGNIAGNFLRIVQVAVYILYIYSNLIRHGDAVPALLMETAPAFNLILIINYIIMCIQYAIPGVLIASHSGVDVMQVDVVCGLFAYGSTHTVALFTVFVVVLNIFARISGLRKWHTNYVYQVSLALFSIVFAELNDNKALWFFLPLVLAMIGGVYLWLNRQFLGMRFSIAVALMVLVSFSAYWLLPMVRSFVDENLINSISIAMRAFSPTAYANGSDERFKIIAYAFSLPEFWMIGDGMGAAGLYEASYRGFPHFGQTDFGSIGILCGVWYYLYIIFMFARVLSAGYARRRLIRVPVLILIVCLSLYTQPFTQVRIAVPSAMLCIVLVQCLVAIFGQSEKRAE